MENPDNQDNEHNHQPQSLCRLWYTLILVPPNIIVHLLATTDKLSVFRRCHYYPFVNSRIFNDITSLIPNFGNS